MQEQAVRPIGMAPTVGLLESAESEQATRDSTHGAAMLGARRYEQRIEHTARTIVEELATLSTGLHHPATGRPCAPFAQTILPVGQL